MTKTNVDGGQFVLKCLRAWTSRGEVAASDLESWIVCGLLLKSVNFKTRKVHEVFVLLQ